MTIWYQRCTPCGKDVPAGAMFEHRQKCKEFQASFEPRTPFHGKPNEPITFRPHNTPKV